VLERRNDKAAIYKQIGLKGKGAVAYEVIRPVIATTRYVVEQGWQPCEPHEVYPSTSAWGADGWTYTDLNRARAKYEAVSGT
jgi:hypothetical protein